MYIAPLYLSNREQLTTEQSKHVCEPDLLSMKHVDLDKAIAIAKQFGASRLVVFGSFLKDPENARDLDLAVAGINDWAFFELAARLEEALRVPLDLISLDHANPITRQAERYGEELYAAG